MLYSDATELAIVQRDCNRRVGVGKIRCVEKLSGPKWLERAKPKWRVAIVCPSVSGTVAVDMSRCFKAVCTALFSRTCGDVKAPMTEPWAGSTARARSKSAAVALATMLRSFLKVLSNFRPPNAIFAL